MSNSSGTEAKDPGFKEGRILEERLGVRVLRHELHKPGCGDEVMKFFKDADIGVKGPENVAIVGDRVFTDVLMANMMGAWAVWVRDGVPGAKGSFVCIVGNRWRCMRVRLLTRGCSLKELSERSYRQWNGGVTDRQFLVHEILCSLT